MHLPVLVISQGILLQTLIHDFIGDYHLIGAVGLHYQFKYVEQLACVASRESQECRGLTQFYVEFL